MTFLTDRYWGDSSPYDQLTTDNMKYLTVDQAIEDTKVSPGNLYKAGVELT